MMNWIYYLLEANLYLVIFYGFYRLLLHKETFYLLNRCYLLATALLSFALPFLQVGFFRKEIVEYDQVLFQQVEVEQSIYTLEHFVLLFYSLVVLFFLTRILWGFRHILTMANQTIKRVENGVRIIELENSKTAFSFFNLLFIDPKLEQKSTVLKHEMVHINQKHSFDILLFEFIQIFSWFNPVTYFLKRDIKLLHEFLADEETTRIDIEKYEYAVFLIQNSCGSQNLSLTNQIFNSSILKQRISMLNQKKSAKRARLRLLLTLPLAGAMVCASTMAFTKDYGVVDLYPKKSSSHSLDPQDSLKKKKIKEIEILPAPPAPGQKSKVKGEKSVPPLPPKPPTKLSLGKIAPPPPPVEPPVTKKVKGVKLAPPPPPVEPAPKKSGKDDVIYGDPITIEEPVTKKVKSLTITPSAAVETAPKKQPGKGDVIYGEIIKALS